MATYYAMIRGGWGAVRQFPFFRDALVTFKLGDEHLSDLSEALRLLSRCLFAAGADAVYPSIVGWPCFRSEEQLADMPSQVPRKLANVMTIHLCGSCPMGEDPQRSAVDSFGRVWDAPGLYVADASILCSAPGVNPQGIVLAIAHRNALKFLNDSR